MGGIDSAHVSEMEYTAQPDKRLLALIIMAMVVLPALVVVELAVPSFQPRFIPSGASEAAAVSAGSGKASGATVMVIMPNGVSVDKTMNFQPADITLVVGTNNTIIWKNDDSTDHTVNFISAPSGVTPSSISNSDVPPGTTFGPITLTVPGTYMYHCQFHPSWMIGKIIVKS
jgi:plastocyanin